MKKRNWIWIVLIILCLGAFFGYRAWDQMRTDTQPPVLSVPDETLEISVQEPQSALVQGVSAADNVDGDVTDSIVVESVSLLSGEDGTISVGVAAFDSAGNVAKAQRKARYTDYESPKFTLSGPLLYAYGRSFDVLDTVGAEDVIDGNIQHHVRAMATDGNAITTVGTHKVQFQVTNSLGDTVTQVFPVEVYYADAYDAALTLKEYLVYLPKGAEFNAKSYLDTFTVMGESHILGSMLSENYSLKTRGVVNTAKPGTYSVEYRVTYTEQNERNPANDREYTGYSKLIVVVEG